MIFRLKLPVVSVHVAEIIDAMKIWVTHNVLLYITGYIKGQPSQTYISNSGWVSQYKYYTKQKLGLLANQCHDYVIFTLSDL